MGNQPDRRAYPQAAKREPILKPLTDTGAETSPLVSRDLGKILASCSGSAAPSEILKPRIECIIEPFTNEAQSKHGKQYGHARDRGQIPCCA